MSFWAARPSGSDRELPSVGSSRVALPLRALMAFWSGENIFLDWTLYAFLRIPFQIPWMMSMRILKMSQAPRWTLYTPHGLIFMGSSRISSQEMPILSSSWVRCVFENKCFAFFAPVGTCKHLQGSETRALGVWRFSVPVLNSYEHLFIPCPFNTLSNGSFVRAKILFTWTNKAQRRWRMWPRTSRWGEAWPDCLGSFFSAAISEMDFPHIDRHLGMLQDWAFK